MQKFVCLFVVLPLQQTIPGSIAKNKLVRVINVICLLYSFFGIWALSLDSVFVFHLYVVVTAVPIRIKGTGYISALIEIGAPFR